MKKENYYNFLKKMLLYVSIVLGLYVLYNPNNKSKYNIPHSATSFIYAQF